MLSKPLFRLAIISIIIAIGILLIFQNWKTSKANITKTTKPATSQPVFSEESYLLAISEEISELGYNIETDFPLQAKLSSDSISTLIERAINSGLVSTVAYYNDKLAEMQQNDSLRLQAARYLIVADRFTKEDSRGTLFLLKAKAILEKILTNNPKNLDAKTLKGFILVRTQPVSMEGISVLQEVLSEDPNNTDALYMLGDFSIESGQFEKALERFKKLLSLQPFNSDYNFKVSEVFSRMNIKDSADYYLKRGTEFRTKETLKGQ
ncbi:MAG: tetratricopeptide repeat protein [Bacteroidia bacterium]|nr:tetratricopeptide repeat protein [Bacteroidia bacterium]